MVCFSVQFGVFLLSGLIFGGGSRLSGVDAFSPRGLTHWQLGKHVGGSSVAGMPSSKFRSTPLQEDNVESSNSSVDIVLFGVGDLRIDDHEGLQKAVRRVQRGKSMGLIPLVVLDETTLTRIPGAISHTIDTAALLEASLVDLKAGIERKCNAEMKLHVATGQSSIAEALESILEQAPVSNAKQVVLHVCDLGDADNCLGYGTYSYVTKANLPDKILCQSWSNHLRLDPWGELKFLPASYPEYEKKYRPRVPLLAFEALTYQVKKEACLKLEAVSNTVPSASELSETIQTALDLDKDRCQAEVNTGIYATHWGGLDPKSVGETRVLQELRIYTKECQEDDELWVRHPQYESRNCRRNGRSLDHAAAAWLLRGDGKKPTPSTENLMAGETMTRYLLAPLLFGTVSPRRIWYEAIREFPPFFKNPLRELVEGREWHKLLAARNIRTDPAYKGVDDGKPQYGYWRWHGFLCRYVKAPIKPSRNKHQKEGMVFVHGFGASGSQWLKTMDALSAVEECSAEQGIAPDLLGFGQSEKPPISYSGYVWDSAVNDFIKEIAVGKEKFTSYVIGGNSIGGYVAMLAAASDTVEAKGRKLSGSGGPGSGRCTGLILMNASGPVKSKEEIRSLEESGSSYDRVSAAQNSAMDALPVCKPVARPVARVFGNLLLAYLKPQIQSICKSIYPANPSAVDRALCDIILRDSEDIGAINVMISGTKLPTPRTVNEILAADFGRAKNLEDPFPESFWDGPVLVANGILDPLNDVKTRTRLFDALRDGITTVPLQAGHCPHDEVPIDMAQSISKWMAATKTERASRLEATQGSASSLVGQ